MLDFMHSKQLSTICQLNAKYYKKLVMGIILYLALNIVKHINYLIKLNE